MTDLTAVSIEGQQYPVGVHELAWRPSVYGIVIKDNKILVSPQHGIGHDLPGGGMDFGETYEDTVIREVFEETGIEVKPVRLLDVYTNLFIWKPEDPTRRAAMQSLLFYFLCEPVGGKLSTAGFDEEEKEYAEMAKWISIEELYAGSVASSYDFRPIVKKAWEIENGN